MPDTPPFSAWRRLSRRPAELLKAAWRRDPKGFVATAVAILVAVGAIVAVVYNSVKRPPDVTNETAQFKPHEDQEVVVKRVRTTNWPLYGYDPARTRYLAAKGIKPPFKRLWKYGGRPVLEFPPIYVHGRLYGLDNNGHVFAIDADSGKVLWKRRVAEKNASAPTYSHRRLFVANLEPGHALALNPKNGKTEWRKTLPGRSESSPVVVGRRVFLGDEDGTLYAIDRRNGHTIWTTQLCGSIKAAPAYDHGILYAGDYGGCMNAVNSHTGKVKWQSSSQGLSFGRTGAFYSTPAVAFGRVYSGNNDGRVYSYVAETGTLAWSHSTGGYVYSGPTVANTPRTQPSVYIGSVDGNIYALDAKTGGTRWSQPVGGRVLGSPSAVGNIVYVGTYEGTTTRGFAMKDGREVFTYSTGGANSPVISDGHRIYLTGYSSITALEPVKHRRKARKGAGKRAKGNRKGRKAEGKRAGAKHKGGKAAKRDSGSRRAKRASARRRERARSSRDSRR
jgi:outer membrane protein assembly factor BamB